MQSEDRKVIDAESLIRRIEEMLLMDDISEEQKIEILQKLLLIAKEDRERRTVCPGYQIKSEKLSTYSKSYPPKIKI
jgi:hypothetical protein